MNQLEIADYLKEKAEVELNPRLQQAEFIIRKQAEEIEYWKDKFEKAMGLSQ